MDLKTMLNIHFIKNGIKHFSDVKTSKKEIQKRSDQLNSSVSEYGLNKTKRDEELIVSLTSFPARFKNLDLVIKSMLTQTMKPDRIILYLDDTVDPVTVPENITGLKKYGLEIEYRPHNMKPHKKYYFAMKEHPDSIIVTVDDDLMYPADMVEVFYNAHKKYPDSVVTSRAHRMRFKNGELTKYLTWDWSWEKQDHPSMDLCATGVGGILYPPRCMDERFLDLELIEKLSLPNDDLWLKIMQTIKGTKVVFCGGNIRKNRVLVPDSQEVTLKSVNVMKNNNDTIMNDLMSYFDLTEKNFR